jgi:hypothetical protein
MPSRRGGTPSSSDSDAGAVNLADTDVGMKATRTTEDSWEDVSIVVPTICR